jgi:gluconokinase
MGVAGSGKTTIGIMLAEQLGWKFVDGDDLHPATNKEKMLRGIPLTDEDRQPWLVSIRRTVQNFESKDESVIVACSALKQVYRDILNSGTNISWIYLRGTRELIRDRLEQRSGHFMKSILLESQLQALEEPEDAMVVDIDPSPSEIVKEIRSGLGR